MNDFKPPPTPEIANPPRGDTTRRRPEMWGRGGYLLAIAVIAAVVFAGLAFGWSGWQATGLATVLLFLLPCLAMGIGMMMMMGRGDQAPEERDRRDERDGR